MIAARKRWTVLVSLLLFALPVHVRAEVIASFYARDFGARFPHAVVVVKGTTDSGTEVNANFGFTAISVTPAVLMGPVAGKVSQVDQAYLAKSIRIFSLPINDMQYAALIAVVTKWKANPGNIYNLKSHNCVHFAGEAAQTLGLKVVFDPALMKKPHSFLDNIVHLNPGLK
jgi:hypothetical protein